MAAKATTPKRVPVVSDTAAAKAPVKPAAKPAAKAPTQRSPYCQRRLFGQCGGRLFIRSIAAGAA